jgi:hypothetical protein
MYSGIQVLIYTIFILFNSFLILIINHIRYTFNIDKHLKTNSEQTYNKNIFLLYVSENISESWFIKLKIETDIM